MLCEVVFFYIPLDKINKKIYTLLIKYVKEEVHDRVSN